MISVILPDGARRELASGATGQDLAMSIAEGLARKCVAIEVDGVLQDLHLALNDGASVRLITWDDTEGLEVLRHSSAHVLAQAVVSLFPDAKPTIGPVVDEGFYYDFHVENPFTPEDLAAIEKRVKEIVKAKIPLRRCEVNRAEAIDLFQDNPFKVEIIESVDDGEVGEGETVSYYEQGDFVDLCRGPHVQHTGQVRAFKILKLAGAYWRGDSENPQLQRIYGISFPDKKQLKEHLQMLEEAKKRDHRRIGRDLDLFSFQEEGPGFPFWHANGMLLYNAVADFWRHKHRLAGYDEIRTPMMLSDALWHKSGHYENYKENMYFSNIDEQGFAVKPMNCPGGVLVYKARRHSYRELPLRVAELGHVHRHEMSGVLHGLFRVRSFTQDDAHIYCRPDQIMDEVVGVMELVRDIYGAFGFENVEIELSTRPGKSIGTDEMWENAEAQLQGALETSGVEYKLNPGDGAFYGPKIDFHIRDCMNRSWQCGTIQLDFALPERFDCTYEGGDGNRHRPVMIHRALLGSLERFIGILIEHYAGKFPLWLNPAQVRVLPVSDKFSDYAKEVAADWFQAGIRAAADVRNETLGKRIRETQLMRVNYQAIVGEREVADGTVSVRSRNGEQIGVFTIAEFRDRLLAEINERTIPGDAFPEKAS
ncbi:MAG: threonine--tRNA ligase [Myxococcales bacterium]|nr:threonine--tRNA ligase [Myxococcales bacterium]